MMDFDEIGSLDGENMKDTDEVQYTTFRKTYKIITFAMAIGLIYPNPEAGIRRLICIVFAILSVSPISSVVLYEIYTSWLQGDVINIIRHSTVVLPLLLIFFKMMALFFKRKTAMQIIDEIDSDYASYNNLPPSYKHIVTTHLKSNLFYSEKCWAIIVVICVSIFPGMAMVLNIYNSLFKSEPTMYMVHDINKPNAPPEERFESPFFEIMFVYTCYCAMFYIINFTGFDGFFGLIINHACLKMDLYCKAFDDAMKANTKAEMHKKLAEAIKEHNKMFAFVDLIQETFNSWLGVIMIATMIQICNCMYHITEGAELDPRYIIFILGVILHIYLPCRYSSKLKHKSLETATLLYCGGWERVYDVSARRTLLMMIGRCQAPLEITAFNLLVFDMDLFVSILKTSYSMYTLLRT